jgi:hypothetical protein
MLREERSGAGVKPAPGLPDSLSAPPVAAVATVIAATISPSAAAVPAMVVAAASATVASAIIPCIMVRTIVGATAPTTAVAATIIADIMVRAIVGAAATTSAVSAAVIADIVVRTVVGATAAPQTCGLTPSSIIASPVVGAALRDIRPKGIVGRGSCDPVLDL